MNAGAQIGPIALPLRPRASHGIVAHIRITCAVVHCSVISFIEKSKGGGTREGESTEKYKSGEEEGEEERNRVIQFLREREETLLPDFYGK